MSQQHSVIAGLQDWLLAKAMGAETRKAGLRRAAVQLPFGSIGYLRSADSECTPTAIVMLHGAGADHSAWIRFARELKAGLPLLIPDLPGHGASTADPALSYSIAAQTERLGQFLAALGVARVHLVASSMGAAIALRLAAEAPQLVASLVLIGAMGVRAKASWLERRIAETGHNPMVRIRDKADYLSMLRIGMNKPPYMPGFVLSALARSQVARSPINQKIARDIEADLDQGASLHRVSCPVLLVWGREDRVSDVANAEKLHAELASSRLAVLDRIGHVPMVEAPAQVAQLCRGFLAPLVQGDGQAAAPPAGKDEQLRLGPGNAS